MTSIAEPYSPLDPQERVTLVFVHEADAARPPLYVTGPLHPAELAGYREVGICTCRRTSTTCPTCLSVGSAR